MAIVVASGTAVSTAANTKSADQVTGVNQYVGKGTIQLIARGSATGMNITLAVNGVPLVDDSAIPYTGTAGAISANDHLLVSQAVNGGRVQLFLRNTTGGALTTDYLVFFTPSR
jgi:hypothetical protein